MVLRPRLRVKMTVPAGTRYLRGARISNGVSKRRSHPLLPLSSGPIRRRPVKGSSAGMTITANPASLVIRAEECGLFAQPENNEMRPRAPAVETEGRMRTVWTGINASAGTIWKGRFAVSARSNSKRVYFVHVSERGLDGLQWVCYNPETD